MRPAASLCLELVSWHVLTLPQTRFAAVGSSKCANTILINGSHVILTVRRIGIPHPSPLTPRTFSVCSFRSLPFGGWEGGKRARQDANLARGRGRCDWTPALLRVDSFLIRSDWVTFTHPAYFSKPLQDQRRLPTIRNEAHAACRPPTIRRARAQSLQGVCRSARPPSSRIRDASRRSGCANPKVWRCASGSHARTTGPPAQSIVRALRTRPF